MSSKFSGTHEVHRTADTGNQYLGWEIIIFVDLYDRSDQCDAVLGDIVKPTDKRTRESSAGFGDEYGLCGRKDKSDIDPNTLAAERLSGFEPLRNSGL